VVAQLVWINYQLTRRASLDPILRFNVYDNAASPRANFLMPAKMTAAAVANLTADSRGGVSYDSSPPPAPPPPAGEVEEPKMQWEMPTAGAYTRPPFSSTYNAFRISSPRSAPVCHVSVDVLQR